MRVLVLMRGVPGSGKSFFIKQNNLESFTLSPDILRLAFAGPALGVDNHLGISQDNDNVVWKLLFELLEKRMQNGEFSIIDATHIKNNAVRAYEDLCEKYRYRIIVVDFSDISLEIALSRNAMRGKVLESKNDENSKNDNFEDFIKVIESITPVNTDLTHYKCVKDSVIIKMYENLQESIKTSLPNRYKIIKPAQTNELRYMPLDLSKYKKIHHFGDIHGCYDALMEYFKFANNASNIESFKADSKDCKDYIESINHKDLIKQDEYYIFCGDYIDRGVENGKVVRFLLDIMDLPNVCLIEGNHERYLKIWGEGEIVRATEFRHFTLRDLESENITQKDARNLYRKLRQCAFYTYGNIESSAKKVLVTHGGLPRMPQNLLLISTHNLIYGSGDYGDVSVCADAFMKNSKENEYQIFGHRNKEELPLRYLHRNFILEGKVEFGGDLRVVTLDNLQSSKNANFEDSIKVIESITKDSIESNQKVRILRHSDGFSEIYVRNILHKKALNFIQSYNLIELIEKMRQSSLVKEKIFFDGRISSFNFSPKAFFNKSWNNLTCKARGLFVDVENLRILARSYDKFFNLDEMPKNSLESLCESLSYPLNVYVKENGFLGILSVDSVNDEFFLTSKSDPTSEFSKVFKELFERHFSNLDSKERLKNYLKTNNLSLIFEVIEPHFDPHIIEYDSAKIVLLDAIYNTLESKKLSFESLQELANEYHFECKIKACELALAQELRDFIDKTCKIDYQFKQNLESKERHIEGFVIEDSKGYMFKVKLHYYNTWKALRGCIELSLQKEHLILQRFLKTASKNETWIMDFWDFIESKVAENSLKFLENKDIITLRKMWLDSKK